MPDIVSRFVDCHVFRRTPTGEEWLVMYRAPHCVIPNTWQMVQGSIEPGEKAYETAARELQEETGLRAKQLFQASYVNRFYLAETDQIVLSPVFCAEVAGNVTLNEEHTDHKWVTFEEAQSLYPWPGQKKSIAICRQQFVVGPHRPESDVTHLLS